MTETELSPEELYQDGIKRYQEGETPENLIPIFKQITNRAPKTSSAWISLSWLYLLADKPKLAYEAAKTAIKVNPNDPQGQINLSLAMLAVGQKGVRPHIEKAGYLILADKDWASEVQANIEDGLQRKPDWKDLMRVKKWLFEE